MKKDDKLIRQTLQGDKRSFGLLVKKYQNAIYGYAYHILGNFADAEDLTQEVFIRAYNKLDSLRDYTKFSSWLRTITANMAKRHIESRREAIPLEDVPECFIAEDSSLAEKVEAKELQQSVMNVVNSLPEHNRLVVTLYYIDGLSYKEISNFLEVPLTTVEGRMHRAKKQLKKEMLTMIREAYAENKLPNDFSDRVISELLARPKLLEIPNHPLRKVWDEIKQALPDYTVINTPEIESIQDNRDFNTPLEDYGVFYVDQQTMLRPHTTTALLIELRGRKPPVKLLNAGRVFRPCKEDAHHQQVFHQIECLHAGREVTLELLQATLQKVVKTLLGEVELRFDQQSYPFIEEGKGWDVSAKVNGKWLEILGTGMFTKEIISQAGHNPEEISAFGFGLGIERIAMIKYGIDNMKDFWKTESYR